MIGFGTVDTNNVRNFYNFGSVKEQTKFIYRPKPPLLWVDLSHRRRFCRRRLRRCRTPFCLKGFFWVLSLTVCVCVCVCGLRIQLGDNSFGWYYMDSSLGVDLFELSGYGQLCVLSRWSIELLDNSLYWFCMDKANRYLSTKGYCFSNCLLYNCWRIWYKLSDWTWFCMTWVRRQSLKLVKYMSH